MKKRILSGLLALLMVASILPASTFAEEGQTQPTTQPSEAQVAPAALGPCPTCNQEDCTSDHKNWCAECGKDDCGVDHTAPKPCTTCGSTECGGSHENWCAECRKDNCGVDHTRIPETSTGPKNIGEKNHPMVGKIVKLAGTPHPIENPEVSTAGAIVGKTAYPERMEIEAILTINGTDYYQLKAVEGDTWPDYPVAFNQYTKYEHYWLISSETALIEEPEEETPVILEQQTESGLTIYMEGMIPADIQLFAHDMTIDSEKFELAEDEEVLAAVDIKLQTAEGQEYQPYTDATEVVVTMDAEALGLSDGDVVTVRHQHGDEITVYEPYVVIGGKLTFWTDRFSVYVVSQLGSTATNPANKINNDETYTIEVGDTVVFYEDTNRNNNNKIRGLWAVTDDTNAVDATVLNNGNDEWGNPVFAPWVQLKAIDQGTVTLKYTYQTPNSSSPTVTTIDVKVVAPQPDQGETTKLYVDDDTAESGCLLPAWSHGAPEDAVKYRWTRSDGIAIQTTALHDTNGGVNISIDRGGVSNNSTPITYTVTAYGANDSVLATAAFEVIYGNEILNPSFESPGNFADHITLHNGYEGLYWKTTAPGSGDALGMDVELGREGSSAYGVEKAADGEYFAELNAEAFGTLYQDILTTPGATLSWQFSHAARSGAAKNQMYIVMSKTENAQNINDEDTIKALIEAANGPTDGTNPPHIPSSGEGYSFTYDGDTYRIWYNDANSGVGVWETVSGTYTIPEQQYLTRLFFVSNPLNLNQQSTLGNLIDGVKAGEYMDYIVEYYETQTLVEDKTETGEDVKAYTTVDLKNLQHFLDRYQYPYEILVNGKPYSGTVADLQRGLYMIDYGTKENGAGDTKYDAYDTVVQIYFQVPNVRVTKTVQIQNWDALSAAKKQELLNKGLQAKFLMQNDNAATEQYTASVGITQQGTDGSLSASTSFPIDQEVYGKPYTVTETSATQIDGYEMVTTITNDKFTLNQKDGPHVVNVAVTNTYYPRGDLKVTKYVAKESEADADPDPDLQFTFTVDLPDDPIPKTEFPCKIYDGKGTTDANDDTPVDGSVEQLSVSEGKLTFALKHNQYIVIENLPVGAVTITEAAAAGFVSEFDKTSYSIKAGETESAVCTNTMERATGTITIKKQMFIGSRYDGQTFLFRITGPDGFSMSISLKPEESKVIYGLPLGEYTITEDLSWSWRYNYVGLPRATVDLNEEPDDYATFTNKWIEDKWLNATDVKSNTFTASSPTNS